MNLASNYSVSQANGDWQYTRVGGNLVVAGDVMLSRMQMQVEGELRAVGSLSWSDFPARALVSTTDIALGALTVSSVTESRNMAWTISVRGTAKRGPLGTLLLMVRAYWGSLFDPSREAGVDETYRRKTSDARERDVERGRIGQTRNIRRRYVLPGTKTKKKSNVHGIYDDHQGGPARP